MGGAGGDTVMKREKKEKRIFGSKMRSNIQIISVLKGAEKMEGRKLKRMNPQNKRD